jgi:hypothetical protein
MIQNIFRIIYARNNLKKTKRKIMHCRIKTNKTKLKKIQSLVKKIEKKIIKKYDKTRETSKEYYKKNFIKNKIKIKIKIR